MDTRSVESRQPPLYGDAVRRRLAAGGPARSDAGWRLAAALLDRGQAGADRPGGDLGARAHAELGEDVGDVERGGLGGDEEALGHLAVAQALGHQLGDLAFPGGERALRAPWRGTEPHQ